MNKCKNCSEYTTNIFCGRSCSASFNNKGTRRVKLSPCLGCGERKVKMSRYSKFCTAECKETKRLSKFENTSKTCSICLELKPKEHFHNNESEADGKMRQCKECNSSRVSNHYASSEKRKSYERHGLTFSQYTDMLTKQNGKCAICLELKKVLVVDHDHSCCNKSTSCGKCVRGLLCYGCNAAIGLLKDSLTLLDRAKDYLIQ